MADTINAGTTRPASPTTETGKAGEGKTFVLLGGNKLHRGLVDWLHTKGYRVLVVDWNERPDVTGDLHYRLDVKSAPAILDRLHAEGVAVDGAYTSIDLAVPTVNALHRAYGLRCAPEAFDTVLSKERMAREWKKAGLFNRYSEPYEASRRSELLELSRVQSVIVKPNVAASSRGITVLPAGAGESAFRTALERASEASFDARALVEEFVVGQEFTVEMLGDAEGHVSVYAISVKYHSANTQNGNRVAVKLHYNSHAYPDALFERLAAFGKQCYRALGMKACFGHLEVLMRPDGRFTPVEIGVRSSGFIGSHLASCASGRDFFGDYLRMIHGQTLSDTDYINGPMSSMWYGYDIPQGVTACRETDLSRFLDPRIHCLYHDRSGLKPGTVFDRIPDDTGRDRNGYEMLCGPREVLTIAEVSRAEQAFLQELSRPSTLSVE